MDFSLPYSNHLTARKNGFTLIEILISIAIIFSLLGFATLNLLEVHKKQSIQSTVSVIIADLRAQQTKSMSGNMQKTAIPDNYGVYFDADLYILFKGESYNPDDTSNFEVDLPDNIRIANTTLNGNQLVFLKGSGEIKDFNDVQNSIEVEDIEGKTTKTIELNQYGVAIAN